MALKNEILKIFEQNKGIVISGQDLGDRFHVSRAAIWKSIKSLKEDGHEIISVSNKGYQLAQDSDVLSVEGIRIFLPEALQNIPIQIHDILDSTNNHAKRLITEGAADKTFIFAEQQTSGRGRYGKSFFSPSQSGIYMTMILRPKISIEDSLYFTFAAAVAVCRAIEILTDSSPRIKWVNDIFLGRKKLCGILTEAVSDFESGTVESIVIGIGVNVRMNISQLPEDLRDIVGCLFPEDDISEWNCEPISEPNHVRISRNQLASEIIGQLIHLTDQLLSLDKETGQRTLLQAYKRRSLVLGKKIRYTLNQEVYSGTAMDINEKGNLVVRGEDGNVSILQSGEIALVKESLW